jgi:opacity protein-like surface antigen
MKTLFLALVLLLASIAAAQAYDNTLITNQTEVGGFIAATARYFEVKNESGLLVGGRAAFVLDHAMSVGAGGYGTVRKPAPEDLVGLENLEMAYGGLFLEYTFKPHAVCHASVPVLVGAGQTRFVGDYVDPESGEASDTFFIVEPELDLEFNISRNLRLDLGIGYRHISGTEFAEVSDEDLSGANGTVTLKVGSF